MDPRYREIDHSGDIGIEAWGRDAAGVLESATRGLLSLMVSSEVGRVVERRLEVSAASREDLLVDWLSEVIASASMHGEVYGDVAIERASTHVASGVLRGEPVDPVRHELRFDVKAATYHGLLFEESESGFHARVIFDL
jgi:SHS2 domain-containing protein